jgi:dynactin complex subunit
MYKHLLESSTLWQAVILYVLLGRMLLKITHDHIVFKAELQESQQEVERLRAEFLVMEFRNENEVMRLFPKTAPTRQHARVLLDLFHLLRETNKGPYNFI